METRHNPIPVFGERKAHGPCVLLGYVCKDCGLECHPSENFAAPADTFKSEFCLGQTTKPRGKLIVRFVADLQLA